MNSLISLYTFPTTSTTTKPYPTRTFPTTTILFNRKKFEAKKNIFNIKNDDALTCKSNQSVQQTACLPTHDGNRCTNIPKHEMKK